MIAYSITMFLVAVLFLGVGIAVYRGKTNLINSYHQKNIKESERREYGRAASKSMFVSCATLTLSGVIALFGDDLPIVIAAVAVLFAGLIGFVVVFAKVQKKYNGGMF